MSDFERLAGLIGLPAAMLVMVLLLGSKEVWVWGYTARDLRRQLAEMRRERDEWRVLALQGTKLAAGAVEVAAKVKQP
jgi:hypothetical protein